VLWHVRYGGQFGQVPTAIRLFAAWLVHRQAILRLRDVEHLQLRLSFSTRLMHEWLSDRCIKCAGSGKQQKSRTGQWIKPQGSMQRNAIFRVCSRRATVHGASRRARQHG
jgi:hypothetical protein